MFFVRAFTLQGCADKLTDLERQKRRRVWLVRQREGGRRKSSGRELQGEREVRRG